MAKVVGDSVRYRLFEDGKFEEEYCIMIRQLIHNLDVSKDLINKMDSSIVIAHGMCKFNSAFYQNTMPITQELINEWWENSKKASKGLEDISQILHSAEVVHKPRVRECISLVDAFMQFVLHYREAFCDVVNNHLENRDI